MRATLHEDGLVFVGLDVIGDHRTEVNVTSPTGPGFDALDGVKLEANIMDWIEAHAPESRRESGAPDFRAPRAESLR